MRDLRVREMTPADCTRVAGIRVRAWQSAYRDLVPRSALDALSVERDTEHRRALLARGDASVVDLVAVGPPPAPSAHGSGDGEVLGRVCHGPYRDGEVRTGDAEVYALYVGPRWFGGGAGHALLTESVRRCAAAGFGRVFLWVLKGNGRARRFYERAGFRADGAEQSTEVDGVAVPEVRYVRELPGRAGSPLLRQPGQGVDGCLGEGRVGEGLVEDRASSGVAECAEAFHAGEGHPAVGVVRAQSAAQGGDQGGHRLGGAQHDEEAHGVQGVGDAEFVGGEGRRRAGRAGVAEAGQGVRGGGAARRVAVVEEQDEGLEGAAVARGPQPEGGQFPGPQRSARCGEDIGQFVEVLRRHELPELRRPARLLP